ncbi:hypothetical protein D3C79_839030 [compost metagenome]
MRGAAQAGDDVVVDDHHTERCVTDDDGEDARFDPQGLEGREQGDTGDDAGQGDWQDQHQRDAFLAKEAASVQRRRSQGAEHQRDQCGQTGHLHRQFDRFEHIRSGKRDTEPLQGKALGRKAESGILGVEGIEEDDQDREVQEHQPAPGCQAQAP